jgi:hypothetical protein
LLMKLGTTTSHSPTKLHCEKPPLINSNKNGRMDFP